MKFKILAVNHSISKYENYKNASIALSIQSIKTPIKISSVTLPFIIPIFGFTLSKKVANLTDYNLINIPLGLATFFITVPGGIVGGAFITTAISDYIRKIEKYQKTLLDNTNLIPDYIKAKIIKNFITERVIWEGGGGGGIYFKSSNVYDSKNPHWGGDSYEE